MRGMNACSVIGYYIDYQLTTRAERRHPYPNLSGHDDIPVVDPNERRNQSITRRDIVKLSKISHKDITLRELIFAGIYLKSEIVSQ